MPELPEVQTFTNFFNQYARNQTIQEVIIKDPIMLQHIAPNELNTLIKNHSFGTAQRRGKFMIVPIEDSSKTTRESHQDQRYLVFHFGMSGNLDYTKYSMLTPAMAQYAHIIFIFANNHVLLFISKRKFAKLFVVNDPRQIATVANMGPEPLSLSNAEYMQLLNRHAQKNIKGFLLNQSIIAGIGNEYSNEVLYQAHIDPHLKIAQLTDQQKKCIVTKMHDILTTALSIDTMGQHYPKHWLLAHKRDLICPKHPEHKLIKETIAGRTAVYCPQQLSDK